MPAHGRAMNNPAGSNRFPPTNWSAIVRAGRLETPEAVACLDALIRQYYTALQSHLIIQLRLDEDAASEVLQEFTAERILRSNLLAKADRGKGLFRTFLLNALDNFYFKQLRTARTQRRKPAGGVVSVEELEGFEPSQVEAHPSAAFDEAWALQVMETVRERMESECRVSGRLDIYEVFAGRMLGPLVEGKEPVAYEELVGRFGYRSPEQAGNVLITGKRMFLRVLRAVVGEYVDDEQAIEVEVAELKTILSHPRAWNRSKPGK
jgi:DNA-directed RNA polymerase specialized sigma24 family protein